MPPRIAHILVQRGYRTLAALADSWSGDPAAISARSRFVWRGEQHLRFRQRYGFSFVRLVTGVLHPSTSHGACSSGISIFLQAVYIWFRTLTALLYGIDTTRYDPALVVQVFLFLVLRSLAPCLS